MRNQVVFLIGFILGTIRVLLLVPRLGETTAVIVEAPIMLTASWFVCRWSVDRLDVRRTVSARSLMRLAAFRVNAGEKMHQRAGVKLHQDGMPKAPTGGLLVSDKQDEKRNCLTRECYRGVGHSLTNQLPLPHCSRSSQAPLFPYSM